MLNLSKTGDISQEKWQWLPKDTEISPEQASEGCWLIPLNQYITKQHTLATCRSLGVWIDSDDSLTTIEQIQVWPSVIAIHFPVFADGRGFSIANSLRGRFEYEGEIKAIGQFMLDQLFYLKRCGFDNFTFTDPTDTDAAKTILQAFTQGYQASADQPLPMFKNRMENQP